MTKIKNCRTCTHCEKNNFYGASGDYCILCGTQCALVRRFSDPFCNENLSGWEPRTFAQNVDDNKFPIFIIGGIFLILLSSIINY
jgi:hypothetical protein